MYDMVSRGSVATDLRGGGSLNSSFLRISLLDLTVKKYDNWSTFGEVIVKITLAYFFLRHEFTFGQPCYKSRQKRKLKLKISNP